MLRPVPHEHQRGLYLPVIFVCVRLARKVNARQPLKEDAGNKNRTQRHFLLRDGIENVKLWHFVVLSEEERPCVLVGAFASSLARATIESPLDFMKLRMQIGQQVMKAASPSSAATTKITISVTFAPRALIEVNASCPGVSKKVIFPTAVLT